MALQIAKKIEEQRRRISGDPKKGIPSDPTLANDMARDGINAIFSGIGTFEDGVVTNVTDDWKKLMSYFAAENSKELERLCGKDRDFNESEWGLACLAYIAGDSTCTSDTTLTGGTLRSMLLHTDRNMMENLDAEAGDLLNFSKPESSRTDTSNDSNVEKEDLNNSSNTYSSDIDTSNDEN